MHVITDPHFIISMCKIMVRDPDLNPTVSDIRDFIIDLFILADENNPGYFDSVDDMLVESLITLIYKEGD